MSLTPRVSTDSGTHLSSTTLALHLGQHHEQMAAIVEQEHLSAIITEHHVLTCPCWAGSRTRTFSFRSSPSSFSCLCLFTKALYSRLPEALIHLPAFVFLLCAQLCMLLLVCFWPCMSSREQGRRRGPMWFLMVIRYACCLSACFSSVSHHAWHGYRNEAAWCRQNGRYALMKLSPSLPPYLHASFISAVVLGCHRNRIAANESLSISIGKERQRKHSPFFTKQTVSTIGQLVLPSEDSPSSMYLDSRHGEKNQKKHSNSGRPRMRAARDLQAHTRALQRPRGRPEPDSVAIA